MQARFAAALAALRAVDLGPEDGPFIEPPASAEQLAMISRRLGTPIPSELASLLEQASRFVAGSAQLDFDATVGGVFADARSLGLGELFQVYDYGNGDGLYLEPREPSCRLWWFGHDSWFCTLVARSLVEYVERCASFARLAAGAGEAMEPFQPAAKVAGIDLATACAREQDDRARQFLAALPPGTTICDFRPVSTPAGFDVASYDAVPFARFGELVALKRVGPPGQT